MAEVNLAEVFDVAVEFVVAIHLLGDEEVLGGRRLVDAGVGVVVREVYILLYGDLVGELLGVWITHEPFHVYDQEFGVPHDLVGLADVATLLALLALEVGDDFFLEELAHQVFERHFACYVTCSSAICYYETWT